jgi:hypothetical protein
MSPFLRWIGLQQPEIAQVRDLIGAQRAIGKEISDAATSIWHAEDGNPSIPFGFREEPSPALLRVSHEMVQDSPLRDGRQEEIVRTAADLDPDRFLVFLSGESEDERIRG